MACKKTRGNWSTEDLQKAIEDVRDSKLSTRTASAKYNVLRSTIHDHTTLKVKKISKPSSSPVLTETEEQEMVQWVIQMDEIGYGQCRQQITMKLFDYTGSNNSFTNNQPG